MFVYSYNVHVDGEPLSAGSVFDIVDQTNRNACRIAPASEDQHSPRLDRDQYASYAKYDSLEFRVLPLDPPQKGEPSLICKDEAARQLQRNSNLRWAGVDAFAKPASAGEGRSLVCARSLGE